MTQTGNRQRRGKKLLLLIVVTLCLLAGTTIPVSGQSARSKVKDQLIALISEANSINLNIYPAVYADQVQHALFKAEKLVEHTTPTDEHLNLTRLELQVALDMLVVDLQKATILNLQDLVKAGKLNYQKLTQMYLNRIELYDLNTIQLNSVRMLNPHALAEAEKCDLAFASDPGVATGMFGMPALVKDNINIVGMPTTAGSVALADNYAPYDAHLITRLKVSGAVILGKANLTEFANYMAINMTSGFSSLGGQVLNPYRPVRLLGDTITLNPSGSSAGSGAAAAAALSAITIGTETSGSILSPCFTNFIVGIKPTVGLISRYGVIPISSSQDIAGPMGRNVTDVAVLLSVLAGYDANDDVTEGIGKAGVTDIDYTKSLKLNGLKGKRIGLTGIPAENNVAYPSFQLALKALKDAGAEIITKPNGAALTYYNPNDSNVNPPSPHTIVFDYDFAKDLPAYLVSLDKSYPIKTFQDIIDFNNDYMKTKPEAFPFGQAILIRCNEVDFEAQREQYLADREKDIQYSRVNGIDYLLKKYNLDGLVGASNAGSPTVTGAKAGYPTISIPLAYSGGIRNPVNITFTGTAFSEAQLIEFAYVVEQATNFRIAPGLAEKSDLGATIRAAQEFSDEEQARFQDIYDTALVIYHNKFSTQMDVDKANEELRAIVGQ